METKLRYTSGYSLHFKLNPLTNKFCHADVEAALASSFNEYSKQSEIVSFWSRSVK